MRTGVRLFRFFSLFLSSGAIKGGSQKGESSKSSIAFVTDNDGDPSGKTIGGGVISPVIISYGGPYTKGETGACKGHIGYKRRQNIKKREKKLTNVLVKDLQPASE